jgi:protein-S-isoprenylcysteine O-methyltransferase Ste14
MRVKEEVIELSARTATALLSLLFAVEVFHFWRADPTRITLILLLITEFGSIGLVLFARVPPRRDWAPLTFFAAIGATFYFLALRLAPGIHIVPEAAGSTLQVIGLMWQIFAKSSLWRSFGLLPANRGIVTTGAYRFVRHPIYLGYLIADIGFLLCNFSWYNTLVFAGQFALQGYRIIREEKMLSTDERYVDYTRKVHYRVIRGVF